MISFKLRSVHLHWHPSSEDGCHGKVTSMPKFSISSTSLNWVNYRGLYIHGSDKSYIAWPGIARRHHILGVEHLLGQLRYSQCPAFQVLLTKKLLDVSQLEIYLYCWLPRAVKGAKPGMKKCSLCTRERSISIQKDLLLLKYRLSFLTGAPQKILSFTRKVNSGQNYNSWFETGVSGNSHFPRFHTVS